MASCTAGIVALLSRHESAIVQNIRTCYIRRLRLRNILNHGLQHQWHAEVPSSKIVALKYMPCPTPMQDGDAPEEDVLLGGDEDALLLDEELEDQQDGDLSLLSVFAAKASIADGHQLPSSSALAGEVRCARYEQNQSLPVLWCSLCCCCRLPRQCVHAQVPCHASHVACLPCPPPGQPSGSASLSPVCCVPCRWWRTSLAACRQARQ
jgi:hypothetical protein